MDSIGGVFGGDSPAQRNAWVNQRASILNRGRVTNNLFGVLPDGRSATKRIRDALNDAVVVDSSNRGVHHSFGSDLSVRSTISGTAGIGINLDGGFEDAAGVTPNDVHPTNGPDVDIGPNGLQNFPELVSAFRGDNSLTVSGLLPTSNGDGLADFSVVVPANPAHLLVTATAARVITADVTEQSGEFALDIPITLEPVLFAESFE